MDKKLIEAQDLLLGNINRMCSKFGLNNVMAQLYAILYLSNKPLCLDDMVERLKISKGSASINIRALERYGVVRQIWVKGTRKDYYEAETDISRVVLERINSMAKSRLNEVDKMLNSSTQVLSAANSENFEDAEAAKVFKERLDKLREFYSQAKAMLEFFNMGLTSLEPAKTERKEAKELIA